MGQTNLKVLVGLACVASLGVLLNVLACVLAKNGWMATVIFAYFLAPLPTIICGNLDGGGISLDGSESRGWKDASLFLTGFFMITGFAMPIVFVHTGVIPNSHGPAAVALGMFGAALVYGALLVYIKFFKKSEEDF